jgi:hypothetical protein
MWGWGIRGGLFFLEKRYVHRGTQGYTGVHRGTQGYTEVHRGTQTYTGVHRGSQGYADVHRGTQGYTGVHKGTQLYKGVCIHRGAAKRTGRTPCRSVIKVSSLGMKFSSVL